jgi:hypothetical protein
MKKIKETKQYGDIIERLKFLSKTTESMGLNRLIANIADDLEKLINEQVEYEDEEKEKKKPVIPEKYEMWFSGISTLDQCVQILNDQVNQLIDCVEYLYKKIEK